MPYSHAQAVEILQKNYRAYLRRKRALIPVPDKFFRVPDNFLVSKLQGKDGFYYSLAGSQTLVASLNKGNFKLLEYYLQKGIDPRSMLYDAYFKHRTIFVDTLDAISDVKNTADELIRNPIPGNQVRIFPVLTSQQKFSLEAVETFIPFLQQLYPLHDEELPLLEEYLAGMPLAECFFATVDLDEYYRLGALKMVIKRLLNQIELGDQTAAHITICKHRNLLNMPDIPGACLLTTIAWSVERISSGVITFIFPLHELKDMLVRAYNQLVAEHLFLKRIDWRTSLYFQLINVNVGICANVQSPNSRLVAQMVVPPRMLEICHEIVYGKNNHVGRLTGFGVFTSHCVTEATRSHNRIINIFSAHVKFAMEGHGSRVGSSSMRMHDINHWIRMNAMPPAMRNGIIEWARILEQETGYANSKLSYTLLDLDITSFENLHKDDAERKSIKFNIRALVKFYATIIHGYVNLRQQLQDYHLILIYSVLRDPAWMNKTFAHCQEINAAELQQFFLLKLDEAFGLSNLQHEEVLKSYHANYSITQNVFHYFMWDASVKFKLSLSWFEIMFTHILPEVDIFNWQRNKGLQIKVGELSFMARDISDEFALNLVSAILKNCNVHSRERMVRNLTHLIETYELCNSVTDTLYQELKKILPPPDISCFRGILNRLGIFKPRNAAAHITTAEPIVLTRRSNYTCC